MTGSALLDVMLAVLGGAIRVGTPFLFVSLGECLTEKAGRINLGLEGVLVFSAMAGFGGAYLTGLWWAGVLLAALLPSLRRRLQVLLILLPSLVLLALQMAVGSRLLIPIAFPSVAFGTTTLLRRD